VRVSNVLGGAFAPHVSPDGRSLVFAAYSRRGYDVHLADLDLAAAPPAEAFADPYPAPRGPAPAVAMEESSYRPLPVLRPRFWMPFFAFDSEETRIGALTGGTDPLFRHAWDFGLEWGTGTEKVGAWGSYVYDRWWPTLLATARDTYEQPSAGAVLRTREVVLRAAAPLRRTLRSSLSASLSWRRRRETAGTESLDLGGLEAAGTVSTLRRHPYSISPLGAWLRIAYLQEDTGLGGDADLGKLLFDARGYGRLFGEADVMAVRFAAGATFGSPGLRCSFGVGGFPDGSLDDVVGTRHAVLRGYPEPACGDLDFTGRRFASFNAEYRFPLAHPQHGVRSLPFFLRHLHGAVFTDVADAWSDGEHVRAKTSVGAVLGADITLGHAVPLTATLGVAHGVSRGGETSVYFRAGLAF
jgi:hypothetical protein